MMLQAVISCEDVSGHDPKVIKHTRPTQALVMLHLQPPLLTWAPNAVLQSIPYLLRQHQSTCL